MTQFEFDQLTVMAGSWLITAATKDEAEARAMKRCAEELRQWLRHADTQPDAGPEGEPMQLPPMPAPRVPVIEET
jgi:hypothetical protein